MEEQFYLQNQTKAHTYMHIMKTGKNQNTRELIRHILH